MDGREMLEEILVVAANSIAAYQRRRATVLGVRTNISERRDRICRLKEEVETKPSPEATTEDINAWVTRKFLLESEIRNGEEELRQISEMLPVMEGQLPEAKEKLRGAVEGIVRKHQAQWQTAIDALISDLRTIAAAWPAALDEVRSARELAGAGICSTISFRLNFGKLESLVNDSNSPLVHASTFALAIKGKPPEFTVKERTSLSVMSGE